MHISGGQKSNELRHARASVSRRSLMRTSVTLNELLPEPVRRQRDGLLIRSADIVSSYHLERHIDQHNLKVFSKYDLSVTEIVNANNLQDHIVLIGFGASISYAIRELRRPLFKENYSHPIVILGKFKPAIQCYAHEPGEEVYFIAGSPRVRENLEKLNLENAHSVIVLADEFIEAHTESSDIVKAVDSDLFLLYLNINSILEISSDAFFSMEFCNSDTIAALNMIVLKRTVNQQNSKKRPSESSGRISRNSQHFITGNFEQIEDTAVSMEGGHSLSIDSRNLAHALPIYASGKAFISRALDAMLLQVQPQYG